MIIINDIGLPDVLFRAILNDPYSRGKSDISVTELISPAWMKRLERKHKDDEREVSVREYIWPLFGKAMHYIIEKGAREGEFTEERVFLPTPNGVLSGQFDLIEPLEGEDGKEGFSRLTDLKVTSVYGTKDMIKNGVKPEYEAQLNILAHIINSNEDCDDYEKFGHIYELRLTTINRDWRPRENLKDDYPAQSVSFDVPLWYPTDARDYIGERMELHLGEKEPPPCTDEEQWATVDKWAVMKEKRKNAVKLHDSLGEAERHMFQLEEIRREDPNSKPTTKYYVELRRGDKTKRCDGYCSVKDYCSYYEELKGN